MTKPPKCIIIDCRFVVVRKNAENQASKPTKLDSKQNTHDISLHLCVLLIDYVAYECQTYSAQQRHSTAKHGRPVARVRMTISCLFHYLFHIFLFWFFLQIVLSCVALFSSICRLYMPIAHTGNTFVCVRRQVCVRFYSIIVRRH